MAQIVFSPADLAPGDARSSAFDLASFHFDRIRSMDDPLFEFAYTRLWKEFGARAEMESREALERRFHLRPRMLYEMILVRRGAEFVAVRDHTAIIARDGGHAVVHLSHNLIDPAARRTGLAGWLRALPIATARECLAENGVPLDGRITLVAEMELPISGDEPRIVPLRAYEKAGFRKIDPALVPYHQPDFRAPSAIDASGGPRPLPFQLIVRRIGREHERGISSQETRALVQALYDIYRPQCRPEDFAHPLLDLNRYPAAEGIIPLVAPTQC